MAKDTEKKVAKPAKDKKPNVFVRIGRFFKDCFKELKKVSWPTRKELFKLTGAVIVFLLLATAILGTMDALGAWMLQGLS